MKSIYLLLAVVVFAMPRSATSQTERIVFSAPYSYPEGTTFDKNGNRFFVSSATTGTIGTVDPQGNYKVFYADSGLKSSFGMKIDPAINWLWVCTGDPNYSFYKDPSTFKKMIRVIALDLKDGKKMKDIDLSKLYEGNHFANDLTLDASGNLYVTDSYSPVIYKISNAGVAGVFATSPLFSGKGIGLNGIVWDPGGYLIVVNDANGSLFKISLGHPSSITQIQTPQAFPGGDGLLFQHGELLLVQNKGVNIISKLKSTDQWNSAQVTGRTSVTDRFQNPSTLTEQAGKIYALNAKLNELTDSTVNPSKEFSLQAVIFH